jgi:ATP-binding cassette subfamily B protein
MLQKGLGLTLVSLATTPVLLRMTIVFSRRVESAFSRIRHLDDDLTLNLTEGVEGIQVIRGFGGEPEELARFRRRNRHLRRQRQRVLRGASSFPAVATMLSQLNLVIVLLYGGWSVSRGRLSLGDLLVFAALLERFSDQVVNLADIFNNILQCLVGARRVLSLLDAPVEIKSPSALPGRPAPVRGSVRFERVTFGYRPDRPVLKDVELCVRPGQRVAIFGETGVGKSTLLALVPRFYDTTSGRVLVDDVDVRDLDLAQLRRQIGFVFQESYLVPDTVAGNIAYGQPGAARADIERAARLAQAHDFVMDLPQRYDTRIGAGGRGLSGGQRQRLAVARALLLEPPILLLDDPAAALDTDTEKALFEGLDEATTGRTTFLVAHRPSALQWADLILVVEGGRIVQRGSHGELSGIEGPYKRALGLHRFDSRTESLRPRDDGWATP